MPPAGRWTSWRGNLPIIYNKVETNRETKQGRENEVRFG
jgi:hypothetical protein